jgi:hypothetical protein
MHLIVNHKGEIIAVKLTPGNKGDREPVINLARGIFGKLFSDKGYISKPLTQELIKLGMHLFLALGKI